MNIKYDLRYGQNPDPDEILKWDDIMEYLETIDDDETLYFFTD